MNHLIITGHAGAGKNLIASSVISNFPDVVTQFEFSKSHMPSCEDFRSMFAGTVVIIDECAGDIIRAVGKDLLIKQVGLGLRLVVLCRSIIDLPPDLIDIISVKGGFRHIDIGMNQLLADAPRFKTPMDVELWDRLVETMPSGKTVQAASVILDEMMQSVSAMSLSTGERSLMYGKLGILANAVKLAESMHGHINVFPRKAKSQVAISSDGDELNEK